MLDFLKNPVDIKVNKINNNQRIKEKSKNKTKVVYSGKRLIRN